MLLDAREFEFVGLLQKLQPTTLEILVLNHRIELETTSIKCKRVSTLQNSFTCASLSPPCLFSNCSSMFVTFCDFIFLFLSLQSEASFYPEPIKNSPYSQ